MSRALEKVKAMAGEVIGLPVLDYVPVIYRRPGSGWFAAFPLLIGMPMIYLGELYTGSIFETIGVWVFGCTLGVYFVGRNAPRGLARTSEGLFVTAGDQFLGRPKSFVGSVAPDDVSVGTGFLNKTVMIHGHKHTVGVRFESTLRAMLEASRRDTAATPPPPAPGTPPPGPPDFSARDEQPGADEG